MSAACTQCGFDPDPEPLVSLPGPPEPERNTALELVARVAVVYGLRPVQIRFRSHLHAITWPRQVAMYAVRKRLGFSYPRIGYLFGGFHHTSVIHAVAHVERERARVPALDELLLELESHG